MARDHWISRSTPVIVHLVNIGMTDAAELDLYQDIVGAEVATLKGEERQRLFRLSRSVSV